MCMCAHGENGAYLDRVSSPSCCHTLCECCNLEQNKLKILVHKSCFCFIGISLIKVNVFVRVK